MKLKRVLMVGQYFVLVSNNVHIFYVDNQIFHNVKYLLRLLTCNFVLRFTNFKRIC